jgi:hypothetical protein
MKRLKIIKQRRGGAEEEEDEDEEEKRRKIIIKKKSKKQQEEKKICSSKTRCDSGKNPYFPRRLAMYSAASNVPLPRTGLESSPCSDP